jgi:superfamily II DNA/RNA helicase
LFSRRTKQWNLSPVLDAVVDLVIEHHTTEKVVVLADSNAQVEELESRLNDVVANPSSVYLVFGSQSREEQRETIDKFDEPEGAGILIGTGDLLGEGVDMQHASVAINMATGGVNQELVQRIGRVLRNPANTPKHAMFYNVVGVPPTEAAAVPREDGKQLIEQAAGFCSLGRRFNKLPGFATSTSLDGDVLETLLDEGAQFIDSLDTDGEYNWDKEIINRADLTALHDAVQADAGDVKTILGEWEEYAWEHSEERDEETDAVDPEEAADTTGDEKEAREDEMSSGLGDEETLSATQRNRIEDLVRLQPTKNTTLQNRWELSSGSAVHEYLQSELADYHFRDGDSLIWASDETEALVNGDRQSREDSTQSKPDLGTEPDLANGKQHGSQAASNTSEDDSSSETTASVETDESSSEQDEPEEDVDSSTETDSATVEQTIFWNRDADTITEFEDDESVGDSSTADGDALDSKIDEWKAQLLDLTRRNKLVSFKPTKSKSLSFEETNPTTVAAELNDDGEIHLRKQPTDDAEDEQPDAASNELLPTRSPDEAANSLSQIGLKNKQYLRERGVDSLYLSLGMLRWYSVDHSDDANRSPLFLAHIELEEKTIQDGDKHDYVLKPKAEGIRLNPALRKKLAAGRDISLPADTALSLTDIDAAFETVYETLRGFDRWTIQPDVVLGIFDFTKFSLYSDLERNRSAVKNTPIFRHSTARWGRYRTPKATLRRRQRRNSTTLSILSIRIKSSTQTPVSKRQSRRRNAGKASFSKAHPEQGRVKPLRTSSRRNSLPVSASSS